MSEEDIPVITDREELYDKCENMEQLFDKYYLPLLDKHYSKTYKLQQENKQLKDNWNKLKKWLRIKDILANSKINPQSIKFKDLLKHMEYLEKEK